MPRFKLMLLPAAILPALGYGVAVSHGGDVVSTVGALACGLVGGAIVTTWLALILTPHE